MAKISVSTKIYSDDHHDEATRVDVEQSFALTTDTAVFLALRHTKKPHLDAQQFVYLTAEEATEVALEILALCHDAGYDLNGEKTND